MKLLMFNTKEFWYKTFERTIEAAEDFEEEEKIENTLVIFINAEKEDEEKSGKVVKKAVGNIAWLARKTDRRRVVLHAFAHLSSSKSSVEFAEKTIKNIKDKLEAKGYDVSTTPFGYFLEFKIHVMGESLAKVWKDIS